ncbi:MAG: hypothetical protein QM541_04300 [Flavobacterium sp.]|nr:hypothetical protein [Flavobacterium sp.]
MTNQAQQILYLQNLQEDVKSLRRAFTVYPVQFDYTNNKIQASYLLTYFPHYTELLQVALNKTNSTIATENINNLLLFGSGPCPEIIGYLKYLNEHNANNNRTIKASIYDIASTHWQYSRNIVFNNIVPNLKKQSIINQTAKDLRIDNSFTANPIAEKSLVVFQNCLNEITEDKHQVVVDNFSKIYTAIPQGSYIVIIDLSEYDSVINLITRIQTTLSSNDTAQIIRNVSEGGLNRQSSYANPIPFIRENLLTGIPFQVQNGLIPKRHIKFTYIIIKKT